MICEQKSENRKESAWNMENTFENKEYRDTYRHSTSHILAQAVKRLYPDAKLAIGPAIDDGFYYDIDCETTFTPEILEQIEGEMRKICKEKLKIERFELPRAEAIKFMEERDEPYKVELIEALPADAVARLDAMTESLKEKLPHCPDLFAQGDAARVW